MLVNKFRNVARRSNLVRSSPETVIRVGRDGSVSRSLPSGNLKRVSKTFAYSLFSFLATLASPDGILNLILPATKRKVRFFTARPNSTVKSALETESSSARIGSLKNTGTFASSNFLHADRN